MPSPGRGRERNSSPVAVSHNLIVLSALAETRRDPSGLKLMSETESECPLSARTSSPVVVSHNLMADPNPPVAIREPSGEKQTQNAACPGPCTMLRSSPKVDACHSRIVLSLLAEAISLPSGLTATSFTFALCPESVATSAPVATAQTLIDLSPLADTSRVPSGLKLTS